jgi:hypothetical protein
MRRRWYGIPKGAQYFPFSILVFSTLSSSATVLGLLCTVTLRGSGEGVLEETAFDGSEESEVDTFYIGRLATKRVCDGFGGKREKKEGFVGWIGLIRRKGCVRMQVGSKNQLRNATALVLA